MGPEMTLGPWYWWSRRESNPRPQAFAGQFYMRSRLIWVSPLAPRSGTLRKVPVTCSCRSPSDPMADQPM